MATAALFVCTAIAAWYLARAISNTRLRRWDPFFAVFLVSALTYLVFAPINVAVSRAAKGDGPSTGDYAWYMTLVTATFVAPLVTIYSRRVTRERRTTGTHQQVGRGSGSLLVVNERRAFGFSLLFMALAGAAFVSKVSTEGLFSRIGTEAAALQVTQRSNIVTILWRTFQDSALLMAAVLILAASSASRTTRKLALGSLAVVSGAYLIPTTINSRLGASLYVLNLFAWSFVISKRVASRSILRRRLIFAGLLIFSSVQVTMNSRAILGSPDESPAIRLYSPVGDSQGWSRLDCIDPVVRVGRQTLASPDGLAPWSVVTWQLRRYLDPTGFDNFRLSFQTDVKQHFIQSYINPEAKDYFSCSLVEVVGSFGILGFVAAAAIYAAFFARAGRTILRWRSSTPSKLIGASFVVTWLLPFEKGISVHLFGWLNVVPVLLALLLLPPFTRTKVAPDELRDRSSTEATTSQRLPTP